MRAVKKTIVMAALVLCAQGASIAHASEPPLTVLLVGGEEANSFQVKLSPDGRTYEIWSNAPLEVGGTVCWHPESKVDELLCEAPAIGGFEVSAGGGNDIVEIFATVGIPVTLDGGAGADRLVGGNGIDRLRGGDGSDTLAGHRARDHLAGGSGSDVLFGAGGNDVLAGEANSDTLHGGTGEDLVVGGGGNDLLYGGHGEDLLAGGLGRDRIDAGPGDDRIVGGPGDSIFGGPGRDILEPGNVVISTRRG
jgi:hypothetical protein